VTTEEGTLATLGPGDFFGEIAILGDGRRTATVTTTSRSQLLVMHGTEFRRLQKAHPGISGRIAEAMRRRVSPAPERITRPWRRVNGFRAGIDLGAGMRSGPEGVAPTHPPARVLVNPQDGAEGSSRQGRRLSERLTWHYDRPGNAGLLASLRDERRAGEQLLSRMHAPAAVDNRRGRCRHGSGWVRFASEAQHVQIR
jgi:Cyclic nucleotide-binding domain